MLDRTNDWEPLDPPRFSYLNRAAGMQSEPGRPMRAPDPGLHPAPVKRVIRAIRRATG